MFGDIAPDNGTDFGNDGCHIAFDKITGVNFGSQNYGENDDEVDSDSDSENECSHDD